VNMATAYRWSEEFTNHRSGGALAPHGVSRARVMPGNAEHRASLRDDESGASAEKRKVVPARVFGAVRNRHFKKPAMVEFYTVKRIDNSRLVRHVEPVKLHNLYKTAFLGGILAMFCMLYVYQHFRCIDLSFQLEDLKAKQAQAQSLNSDLKLTIATLRDPERIDQIAQKELGLKRPESAQVRDYAVVDGSEVAAVQDARANHAP
jgi:cell division protein FtsL